MQTGVRSLLNKLRAKLAGRLLGHHAVENQLQLVGLPHGQVVADDILQGFTAPQPSVEDVSGPLPLASG